MKNELYEKVVAFRTAMSVVKSMLHDGLITSDDYLELERILAEKYGLSLFTIFREF